MAKVIIDGKDYKYEDGTLLETIADDFADQFKDDIVLAEYKGSLTELSKRVSGVGKLRFVTTAEPNGRKTYRRSVIFLMQRALMDILPSEADVKVEHTLGSGYFCVIEGREPLSQDELDSLKAEMIELADANIPLKKYSVKTKQAREQFKNFHMNDKARLLRYRTSSNINVYDLDECIDYFYGYMVPSTKYLKYFDLMKFEHGFMLLLPNNNTREVAEFTRPMKLFSVQQQSFNWAKSMEIPTVGALNDAIAQGRTLDIILSQEATMERRIGEIAEMVANDPAKKFIMIAGPSSSGKTTFSHRLSAQLRAFGCTPHPIPLDDYYLDRDQMPLDEFGNKDFESIEGLDIEQFNQDMNKLLAGERVELPTFNFKTGKREYKGKFLQLKPNDILVIEGIHGLNERMSYSLPAESKFKIYISALTQLSIDEHNPLSTTDGRLIRRIVRDSRTRGTSAARTIEMWPSVRRGEEKWIFPYQEQADAMINSALIYEMAVLKLYAEPQLYNIPEDDPAYMEAKRLIKLLDYFLPLAPENIPNNSLLREFIGGSCIDV